MWWSRDESACTYILYTYTRVYNEISYEDRKACFLLVPSSLSIISRARVSYARTRCPRVDDGLLLLFLRLRPLLIGRCSEDDHDVFYNIIFIKSSMYTFLFSFFEYFYAYPLLTTVLRGMKIIYSPNKLKIYV